MREKISMLKKRHGGARLPKAIVEKKDVGILIFAYFGHFLIEQKYFLTFFCYVLVLKYKTKIGILGDYLMPYIEVKFWSTMEIDVFLSPSQNLKSFWQYVRFGQFRAHILEFDNTANLKIHNPDFQNEIYLYCSS